MLVDRSVMWNHGDKPTVDNFSCNRIDTGNPPRLGLGRERTQPTAIIFDPVTAFPPAACSKLRETADALLGRMKRQGEGVSGSFGLNYECWEIVVSTSSFCASYHYASRWSHARRQNANGFADRSPCRNKFVCAPCDKPVQQFGSGEAGSRNLDRVHYRDFTEPCSRSRLFIEQPQFILTLIQGIGRAVRLAATIASYTRCPSAIRPVESRTVSSS